MALLEVQDIQVYYGMIQALKGVSFSVNEGEVIALIGANGAGKTTTLHTVTGLLRAKSGHIIYDGQDITKVPPSQDCNNGYGTCSGRKTCVCKYDCSSESEDGCFYKI